MRKRFLTALLGSSQLQSRGRFALKCVEIPLHCSSFKDNTLSAGTSLGCRAGCLIRLVDISIVCIRGSWFHCIKSASVLLPVISLTFSQWKSHCKRYFCLSSLDHVSTSHHVCFHLEHRLNHLHLINISIALLSLPKYLRPHFSFLIQNGQIRRYNSKKWLLLPRSTNQARRPRPQW